MPEKVCRLERSSKGWIAQSRFPVTTGSYKSTIRSRSDFFIQMVGGEYCLIRVYYKVFMNDDEAEVEKREIIFSNPLRSIVLSNAFIIRNAFLSNGWFLVPSWVRE